MRTERTISWDVSLPMNLLQKPPAAKNVTTNLEGSSTLRPPKRKLKPWHLSSSYLPTGCGGGGGDNQRLRLLERCKGRGGGEGFGCL